MHLHRHTRLWPCCKSPGVQSNCLGTPSRHTEAQTILCHIRKCHFYYYTHHFQSSCDHSPSCTHGSVRTHTQAQHTHSHTHTHTHTRMHAHKHKHIHKHIRVHTDTCVHTIHTHACTHTNMHNTHAHIRTHIHHQPPHSPISKVDSFAICISVRSKVQHSTSFEGEIQRRMRFIFW